MKESLREKAQCIWSRASFQKPLPSCARWVLDTNVILDLLVFHDKEVHRLDDAITSGALQIVMHPETFAELTDVLSRPYFKVPAEDLEPMLLAWLSRCIAITDVLTNEAFCRDTDDNKFFEVARLSSARVLVTKDKLVWKARKRAKRFECEVIQPQQLALFLP